jgi:hypothetical protein
MQLKGKNKPTVEPVNDFSGSLAQRHCRRNCLRRRVTMRGRCMTSAGPVESFFSGLKRTMGATLTSRKPG